ncbi:uncharacterized protein LOC118435072 [Folsomia candida]|nr:uncharacterized protein LOC118435072 [Folsomia candida]
MEKMVKFMYFVPEKGSQVQARHSPVVLTYSPLLSNTMHINDSDIPDYIMGFGTDAMIPDQIHQKYQPNIPCVTFGIVAVIFRYLFGCSADCLILIIVLSLWFPVADFAKFIRIERRMTKSILTPADAFVEYRSLKRLANLINATIRNLIIFVILQAIFFYPVGIKQVVASCDSSGVHYIGFFLLSFCITFYFAADICKQMQSFQAYLRDEHRQWEFAKLDRYMILQETVTNPIGIADEGRFTVDFPFVAAVTSTLMTYFIVSVQYDDKHKS